MFKTFDFFIFCFLSDIYRYMEKNKMFFKHYPRMTSGGLKQHKGTKIFMFG